MDPYYLALTTVTLASIYGLLALGISIIWSSLGMINLAQGFTFAVAGYGAWLVAQGLTPADFTFVVLGLTVKLYGFIVLIGGVLTGALAGAVIGGVAFIPLYDKPNFPLRSLIATLAISLLAGRPCCGFSDPG